MHCHTWASSKYEWVVGSRREYLDQQDELSCPVTFLLQYVAVCADLPQLHRSSSKSSREDLEDILNPKRCLLQVMHGLQHVSEAKDTHQLESSSSSSSSSSRSFPASEPISCAMTRTAIDDLHKSVLQTSTREWRNPIEVLMDKLRQPGGRRGLSTEYFRHLRELGSLQNSLHNRATGDPSLSTFLGWAVESSGLKHCKRGGAGRARNNKRHSSGSDGDNHPSKLQKSGTSRYLGSSSSNAHAASSSRPRRDDGDDDDDSDSDPEEQNDEDAYLQFSWDLAAKIEAAAVQFERTFHENADGSKVPLKQLLKAFIADIWRQLQAKQSEANCRGSLSDDSQNDDVDAITLGTVHSSKGREWRAVLVVDTDESVYHNSCPGSEYHESVRNVAYVACSRAKERLFLSFPRPFYQRDEKYAKNFSNHFRPLDKLQSYTLALRKWIDGRMFVVGETHLGQLIQMQRKAIEVASIRQQEDAMKARQMQLLVPSPDDVTAVTSPMPSSVSSLIAPTTPSSSRCAGAGDEKIASDKFMPTLGSNALAVSSAAGSEIQAAVEAEVSDQKMQTNSNSSSWTRAASSPTQPGTEMSLRTPNKVNSASRNDHDLDIEYDEDGDDDSEAILATLEAEMASFRNTSVAVPVEAPPTPPGSATLHKASLERPNKFSIPEHSGGHEVEDVEARMLVAEMTEEADNDAATDLTREISETEALLALMVAEELADFEMISDSSRESNT
jgi:hypothetical protein